LLKAGKSLKLEATLALTEAEIFEHAEFWITKMEKCRIFIVLINHYISQVTALSSPTVIEIQSIDVRVLTIYRGFPPSFYPDVLLVTNHKT
jgi:hypothetical protein